MRTFLRIVALWVVLLTSVQFAECAKGCDCAFGPTTSSVAGPAGADQDGCLCCSQCLGSKELLVVLPDSMMEPVAPLLSIDIPLAPPSSVDRPPRS
jgi:hypothetical protein